MLQLMAEHPFPWSREVWARLLDRLLESGARLVIFDLIFGPPKEGDQLFRAALDRYRDRVVVGATFDLEHGNEFVAPNADLIPPPAQYDDRVGYVNYWIDQQDGMLRAERFFTSERQLAGQKPSPTERLCASLTARAMEKLGRSNDVPHDLKDHLIRFSATDAYQPYPIWEIADPDLWHSKYSDGEFFEDKIVIVGPSASKLGDVIDNPVSPEIKGPVMHLNVLAATMDHEFLRKLPVALDLVIVAVFGLLAWLLLGLRRAMVDLSAVISRAWRRLSLVGISALQSSGDFCSNSSAFTDAAGVRFPRVHCATVTQAFAWHGSRLGASRAPASQSILPSPPRRFC
jgi:CHASE2 domain-containing sensor protein